MMEENAQMSLLPDAVGATQMTMTGEEEIDLSEWRNKGCCNSWRQA